MMTETLDRAAAAIFNHIRDTPASERASYVGHARAALTAAFDFEDEALMDEVRLILSRMYGTVLRDDPQHLVQALCDYFATGKD